MSSTRYCLSLAYSTNAPAFEGLGYLYTSVAFTLWQWQQRGHFLLYFAVRCVLSDLWWRPLLLPEVMWHLCILTPMELGVRRFYRLTEYLIAIFRMFRSQILNWKCWVFIPNDLLKVNCKNSTFWIKILTFVWSTMKPLLIFTNNLSTINCDRNRRTDYHVLLLNFKLKSLTRSHFVTLPAIDRGMLLYKVWIIM